MLVLVNMYAAAYRVFINRSHTQTCSFHTKCVGSNRKVFSSPSLSLIRLLPLFVASLLPFVIAIRELHHSVSVQVECERTNEREGKINGPLADHCHHHLHYHYHKQP